jgi:hypothetical protein
LENPQALYVKRNDGEADCRCSLAPTK